VKFLSDFFDDSSWYTRLAVTPDNEGLVGRRLGHIVVTRKLGEGGMGAIYQGFDNTLERSVALKVIRPEHRLKPQAKARFLREARVLSRLAHPKICAVHDFVETDDGEILVLELIEGRSLREALDEGLSREQAMDVALQLLEVMALVHEHGIVHRDLKPANIMLTPEGNIKVLDFGLARSGAGGVQNGPTVPAVIEDPNPPTIGGDPVTLIDSGMLETEMGAVVGTAGYMSPEQARGDQATAASDMYSIGLILQEMFTGASPFESDIDRSAVVERAKRGETVPVTGLPSDLGRLIERLKSPAPGARPSAADAGERLQWIGNTPRRRRRKVLVAAVWVALTLLAGGMTVQWVRAGREARRAEREAAAASEVSDFLVGLFEESNPEQARGASLSAEEILRRGADRIHEELGEQPLTRARLLITIGRVYNKMGLYAESIPYLEEAVEIREQELGEDHPEVAEALSSLGDYYRRIGDFEKARIALERSLDIRERVFGPDRLEVADSLHGLGILNDNAGRFDEAEAQLRSALKIYETELGPDHVSAAKCLANIAIVIARQGRVEEAEPIFRRVLAIQEKDLGEDHPSVGEARENLAIALKILHKFDEAEALYRRNLEIQEQVLGNDHPDVASTLQNFANLHMEMGQVDTAEPLYLRSLEINRAALGDDHPKVALALDNLGALYIEQERWQEAQAVCEQALSIREKILDPRNPEIALNTYNLGRVYEELGRIREAEAIYRRSVEIAQAALNPDHRHRVMMVEGYAEFLRGHGRGGEAERLEAQEAALRSAQASEPIASGGS
jgi:serine/threonine protein kinase/Tfp pilus assembly protein PilF